MATTADETAPQAPAQQPIYQTPDWEPRTTRPQRNSLLDLLTPSSGAGAGGASNNPTILAGHSGADAITKEQASGAISGPTVRQRLDRVLPPHRTYFGRSRRFLLLFIILPLAILLFVILPLAVGLGVGLSRRKSSSASNLPLPTNTATFTGDLTYYEPGLGACGVTSTSEDDIVAVSHIIFDAASAGSNPNADALCGKKIRIERNYAGTRKRGNISVDVTVVDRCTGCAQTDLDVSLGVFTQLADETDGRVQMSWAWLN